MAGSRASGTICVVSTLHIRPSPHVRYWSHSVFVSTKYIRDPEKIQMVFLPTVVTFKHNFLRDCLPGYRLFLPSVVVCLYATLIHLSRTSYSRIYCGTWCESDRECRYAWNGWKETFVMRLSILNIKKNYALRQGVIASEWGFSRAPTFLKPCVQHPLHHFFSRRAGKGGGELYTDKWWNTHDLFLGWIYYLFSSDLNEKPLEDELYRLPRSGVPQIFQNFIPGTWFPAKANNSVSIAESQSNVFVIFSSRCLLQLQVLDVN